ncbi:MAG: peptidylprolyl isomerase [Planctomycetes bacterium]|nr:peptidylprolyl isomerase [Planctomycetota bacterium]
MAADTKQVVGPNKVVAVYFTLKNEAGEVVETNRRGGKPLIYLHGTKAILPGLEKALEGRAKDAQFSVTIPPELAWGSPRPEFIEKVLRSTFPEDMKVQVGLLVRGVDPNGKPITATIVSIEGDEITIDRNHPLAGKTLYYDVIVAGVRDATREEALHGHVHGAGGAHH